MRLPRPAPPLRYEIHLTPDFAAERFAGTVRVTLDVWEPVRVSARTGPSCFRGCSAGGSGGCCPAPAGCWRKRRMCAFLEAQDLGGMRRRADQMIEALELRAAFARREGDRLLA